MGVMDVTETCGLKRYNPLINKGIIYIKKTLQRAKLKIKLYEAFSFVMWSTIQPMPLKSILDPLKC